MEIHRTAVLYWNATLLDHVFRVETERIKERKESIVHFALRC